MSRINQCPWSDLLHQHSSGCKRKEDAMKAIMVMFDSLNRDYLPNFGCDWVHAPNFARLGEKAVTLDRFYAGSMPCMPARRELHTGRYNFLHRSWGPLEPFDVSMPELLKENGIYTHLITDHFHYFEDGGATYHTRYNTWEFARGQQGDPWVGKVDDPPIPPCENPRRMNVDNWRQDWVNREEMTCESKQPMAVCFQQALGFIDRNAAADDWFLQVEAFDPHEPFYSMQSYKDLYPHDYTGDHYDWINYGPVDDDEKTVDHLRYEYAALLSMCDAYLGQVLDRMDQLNMWEDTMLIVNTDHGLMIGEKQWYGKNVQPFYNEIAHIPCFIHDPRNPSPGQRRQALTQTIDLPPTLLEFFDVDIPSSMQGRSLQPVIEQDQSIREGALFGIHGGHVNVVDDTHIYMRANATVDNGPLFEYTLMPTHMRSMFGVEELQDIAICPRDTFPFIPCDTMKLSSQSYLSSDVYGHLLFDNINDHAQQHPLQDPDVERRMISKLRRLLDESDCPSEQYIRLGLTADPRVSVDGGTHKFDLDTPIRRIMQHDDARQVLEKYFQHYMKHPMFKMAQGLSLRKVQQMSKGKLTDQVMAQIERELHQIK